MRQRKNHQARFIPNYASDIVEELREFTYGDPDLDRDVRELQSGTTSRTYANRRRE